jgi:DivIVA domain-containing protein
MEPMRKDKIVSEVLGEEATITPSDLYNMEFKTSVMGGYDKTEVDALLERVADVMEDLIREVSLLKEKNEEQRSHIDAFREVEAVLKRSLGTIENYKEEILDSARREADALRAEARAIRARAEAEARRLPENIAGEARALRNLRESLRGNIQSILESHRILLDNIPPADESVLQRFEGQAMPPPAPKPEPEPEDGPLPDIDYGEEEKY